MSTPPESTRSASAVAPRRIEGPGKVTGAARYTGDYGALQIGRDVLHAVVVQSTAARGCILSIDTSGAEAVAGVRLVVTHLNAPRLRPVKTLTASELDFFLPMQDNQLHYDGQPIALVVADTLLSAQYGASLVRASYDVAPSPFTDPLQQPMEVKKVGAGEPASVVRGDPEQAFSNAPVQLDLMYSTKPAHHNAIEPAAALAVWDSTGRITVWNSTQFVYGDATSLGQAFGFGPLEQKLRMLPHAAFGIDLGGKIRVVAPLVGGAFGSKCCNATLLLAAMGAKVTGTPVKLVLSRKQTYAMLPYRSAILQRVRVGADSQGRLSALLHESTVENSHVGPFIEPAGEWTPHLYACANLKTSHRVVRLDVNAPGWMRAPGVAPGLFALESAMDELAQELDIDPVEIRLRNYAEQDPETGHDWSSKSLRECYRVAAERIEWQQRDRRCRSMRQNGLLVGFGMASAAYRTMQFPAVARIFFTADGEAVVQSAGHEIGQGAITALSQIAAESLGLPLNRVRFEFGDTDLPFAFLTAGSATTLSIGSAIKLAAEKLFKQLSLRARTDRASPLYGLRSHEVSAAEGRLFSKSHADRHESFTSLLARHPKRTFEAKAVTGRTFGKSRLGRAAFGAQFAEVTVDSELGQVRVRRLVGAFAGGRVINPTLAVSQLRGGMIWGIGQALFEESTLDRRNGRWVNSNLAEALVPTHSDVQHIEALLVDEDDRRGSALGAKGLGEIGITGSAAAIANAVYHATGKRVRELPIRLDGLLDENEIGEDEVSRTTGLEAYSTK